MSFSLVPRRILPLHVPPDRPCDKDIQAEVTQSDAVADSVPWSIVASVELRSNDGAEVADRNLHPTCGCPLRSTGHVHSGPSKCECSCRVDAGGAKEDAEVADAGVVVMWSVDGLAFDGGCDDVVFVVGEEDDVADDGDCAGCNCEGCSNSRFCGDPRDGDGDNGCEAVRWNGEELCLVGAVAEGDDDCGLGDVSRGQPWIRYTNQEERKSVQRQTHGMVCEAIKPDLGVFQGDGNILPCEAFMRRGIIVECEAFCKHVLLISGQEGACFWVVRDEEVRRTSDQNGRDSLENENPFPAIKASNALHVSNSPCENTTERSGEGGSGEEERDSELSFGS